MMKIRTKLLDRVLAATLAVIMVLAMVPASTLAAFAASFEAGSDCQEATCGGTLEWVEDSADGKHCLVCNNSECAYSDVAQAYSSHNRGAGTADCALCTPSHVHGSFTYSVEDENKLVATCGSTGTCDLPDKKVFITIAAPANLKYDGTVKAATIDGATEWKTATGANAPTITYSEEPKNVGTYTASITVSGKTASVTFAITKATPRYTVPTGLTAEYGQTLADVSLPAGFAWEDETASVGEIGENSFEATFTPTDTENFVVVNNITIKVAVGKASRTIDAPSVAESTQTTITLEVVTPSVVGGKVEYGYIDTDTPEEDKDDPSKVTNWQEELTFDGLEGSKTYYFYARVAATDTHAAAVSPVASLATADKLNGELSLSIGSWTYGQSAAAPDYAIVTGDYNMADAKVQYAAKGGTIWYSEVPSDAGEYTVRVSFDATDVYAQVTKSCDFVINQKELTVHWANTTLTYNGESQKPTATISGVIGEDAVTVTVNGEKKNVGIDYTATAVLNGAASHNYVINANASTLFTINTKEIVITWSNLELTHCQDAQKPTAVINESEIFAGDTVTVDVAGEAKTPGDYTAIASLSGESKDNYHLNAALVECVFKIVSLDEPTEPYTIVKASDGTPAAVNENGWYNYDVKVIPKEGFKIGTACNSNADFGQDLLITESTAAYEVYLMEEETGYYTDKIPVGDIKIDKDLPTGSIQINNAEPWDIFLETVTFDIYRKEDITVTISASDDNSDIYQVYYYAVQGTRLTNQDLFDTDTIQGDIDWVEGTTLTINADNDYVVYAKIVDQAGNVSYLSTQGFVYDATKPVINVSFQDEGALNEKYFKADRTATIVITEHNFDGAVLTVTENGIDTSENYSLVWNSEGDEHTATVLFENEADYTFQITCTDKAGNDNEPVVYADGTAAPEAFTIDKSRPNASLVIEGSVNGAEQPWTETWETADGDDATVNVLTSIDYNGRWSNTNAKVSATTTDNLSGVDYIEYFRTDSIVTDVTTATWGNTTAELAENRDTFNFEVAPNEKFIVYAHVVDKAGNDIYLSSNGVIVDDKAPSGGEADAAPDISIIPQDTNKMDCGIYNGDVTVSIEVFDPKYVADAGAEDGFFSGLKEITYKVYAADVSDMAISGTLYSNDLQNPVNAGETVEAEGLVSAWKTDEFVIPAGLEAQQFNSNKVVVEITAIDNAGNSRTSTVRDIPIDVKAPAIHIAYDNNNADSGKYYKSNRTATITVTERNFNFEDFEAIITASPDGVIPTLSDWTTIPGTGNMDDTKHIATITFDTDGDYTFHVEVKDRVLWTCGNVADPSVYGGELTYAEGTRNETEFTIDKTAPVVQVSYDNNSAENGKYFKNIRVATIKVTEHNFNSDRVVFTRDTARGGKLPEIAWKTNGDVHTAVLRYTSDGDYTFDVEMTDMAGNGSGAANYGKSVAANDFVIDTTYENMILQNGVENGVAYGHDAEVIPNIRISDINLQDYTVTLTGIQKDKTIDLTDEVNALLKEGVDTVTGILDVFEVKQELDGIYTLKMTASDKAGNEDSMEIVFTVNRFGSVYVFEDYLLGLVQNGGAFVQTVEGDLIITEYNADRLIADSLKIEITVDGKPLEDVQYTVTPEINDTVSVGSSGWYQYKYTISKDNFAADGVYKIFIASEDATGNTPENSNYEDKGMTFRVDSTQSEITSIVGLEEPIINAQEITVKYTVFDAIGIKNIKVYLNGAIVDEITDLSADPNNYSGSFTVAERNSAQTVQIVVEDLAGNITDTDAEGFAPAYAFNGSVTVSTNFFVRWYADKALFWGSIGGFVALIAALWFFIAKKKKNSAETAAK